MKPSPATTTSKAMNITPEELALAKQQLQRIQALKAVNGDTRLLDPHLTPEDRAILKAYPRHTLQQARDIAGTSVRITHGARDPFHLIRLQETGPPMHISGNHT